MGTTHSIATGFVAAIEVESRLVDGGVLAVDSVRPFGVLVATMAVWFVNVSIGVRGCLIPITCAIVAALASCGVSGEEGTAAGVEGSRSAAQVAEPLHRPPRPSDSDFAERNRLRQQLDACGAAWTATRAESLKAGNTDGEARRTADEQRVACEGPLVEQGKALVPNGPPVPACDALASVPEGRRGGRTPSVIFACVADDNSLGAKPTTSTDVVALFGEFLVKGPSPAERQSGHGVTASNELVVDSITLDSGSLTINLERGFGELGESATWLTGFQREVAANAFQFEEVDEVRFTLKGSCDDLWQHTLMGKCHVISRKEVSG